MLKYEEIVDDISTKIASKVYKANSKIPPVSDLCRIYDVSKITVNKALDELVRIGLITRKRGSGTFVKGSHLVPSAGWKHATTIDGTVATYSKQGKTVTSEVHAFSVVVPTDDVKRALGIDEGFVYYICRTRLLDGVPASIEYTYMPVSMFPDLTVHVVENSIYKYIEDECDLVISSAHSSISPVNPNDQECAWLDIPPSEPLLEIAQIAFLNDGRPFEFSISRTTSIYDPVRIVRLHRHDSQ